VRMRSFFYSSRRRHTRCYRDWSSDVCSSDLAEDLLNAAQKDRSLQFWPSVDGYVLPKEVAAIFVEGGQAHVPLLAGWNAEEASWAVVYAKEKPTAHTFPQQLRARFDDRSAEILKLYPASNDEEAHKS